MAHHDLRVFKAVSSEGFTLVELLIVVAIIAILSAIAIPQFTKYRTRASVVEINSDAKHVYTAAQAYLTDNPNAVITTLTQLQIGGYSKSPNVSFVVGSSMTISSGFIELRTTATGVANNNVLIRFNGRINQAK